MDYEEGILVLGLLNVLTCSRAPKCLDAREQPLVRMLLHG
jgi:hypothetical protein